MRSLFDVLVLSAGFLFIQLVNTRKPSKKWWDPKVFEYGKIIQHFAPKLLKLMTSRMEHFILEFYVTGVLVLANSHVKLHLILKNGYDLSRTPFLDSGRPPEYTKKIMKKFEKIFFSQDILVTLKYAVFWRITHIRTYDICSFTNEIGW